MCGANNQTSNKVGDESFMNALASLGEFSSKFSIFDLDENALSACRKVLIDGLAVMIAGSTLSESVHLRKALPISTGPSTLFGEEETTGVSDAAWLNGVSMVSLELDEGNKYIRGHASAHVLPSCLALAEAHGVDGSSFLSAFVVGHEIASRFGASIQLFPGVHPHGNWGITGSAAACAKLSMGGPLEIARAIDNAGAYALAAPFCAAATGMSVRNGWIGAANVAGIWSSSLAMSDSEGPLVGIAAEGLGKFLGSMDVAKLTEGLGNNFYITSGYFKRHSSCSYTHPPADAAMEIFDQVGPVVSDMVKSITVETHHLASGLTGTTWPTRMAAMFSIPFVVATVLETGKCDPSQFDGDHRISRSRAELGSKVNVINDSGFDKRLPDYRACRLRIEWSDGSANVVEVENPVGDSDNKPFDEEQLMEKAASLIGDKNSEKVAQFVNELPECKNVRGIMAGIREFAVKEFKGVG